jgi:hypothetical protein
VTAILDGLGLSFLGSGRDADDFVPDDAPPSPSDDLAELDRRNDAGEPWVDPKIPICEACERPIEWSGRGRRPKMHPECRRAAGGAARAPRGPSKSKLDKLHEDLLTGAGEASGVLAPFAPVTAVTFATRADKGFDALIRVAVDLAERGHPGMLNGLYSVAAVAPWAEVASFAGAVIYAVGVDAGQLSPDSMVAERLGVAAAAREVGYRPAVEEVPEYVPATADAALGVPPAFAAFQPITT